MCIDGYRGAQCQEEIDVCDPEMGACNFTSSECIHDVNGTAVCTCDPGYTGEISYLLF